MKNFSVEEQITEIVKRALIEDIGYGDITTISVIGDDFIEASAEFLVKDAGVIAGMDVVWIVFKTINPNLSFVPNVMDGDFVKNGDIIAFVSGDAKSILTSERVALNFLQRMSGIATLTRKFVEAVKGTKAKITDTRKTAPGLRLIDKLAVEIGGGVNHRFGLYDMILIKDNHIAIAGGVERAIERCLKYVKEKNIDVKIEVEAQNLEDVKKILKYEEIDRILLDNFSIDDLRRAVDLINGKLEIEASGGITLENVRQIAEAGVDYISIGMLTHSPKALDISLEIKI
ncbi:nicotinate-nucleotide pyrophosphorylase [carboxylating] [Candidatus Kryptobacter tengchongensis]|uniref:Probable nicotinate-nucleotide pyrophosphorylase [carboxylating] n=1 Tax=Kryptobacter tengchongensis TaxID=1643429 RepID=A0A656D554_KRYT1|nr:carboxylating nicotinate-nucleotide diphosphorylase [Candidatus Kryptobacter tengchongensis]CUT00243.1 nicotinate-nucleotide pyrophosphorylase [carboxylating] [Candidatus Kryptobacter tengchongensis]CUU10650.1 nicotinate-nucleotide pyrophosphorylase [carboxylating] [Candidatus Kryptobacter tengchongensis]